MVILNKLVVVVVVVVVIVIFIKKKNETLVLFMRLDMSVFDKFEAILICPWYWSNRPEPISRELSALVKTRNTTS